MGVYVFVYLVRAGDLVGRAVPASQVSHTMLLYVYPATHFNSLVSATAAVPCVQRECFPATETSSIHLKEHNEKIHIIMSMPQVSVQSHRPED